MAAFHMLLESVKDWLPAVEVLIRETTFLLRRRSHNSAACCAGSGRQVAQGSKLYRDRGGALQQSITASTPGNRGPEDRNYLNAQ